MNSVQQLLNDFVLDLLTKVLGWHARDGSSGLLAEETWAVFGQVRGQLTSRQVLLDDQPLHVGAVSYLVNSTWEFKSNGHPGLFPNEINLDERIASIGVFLKICL